MTNTEHDTATPAPAVAQPQTPECPLTWTSKRQWGGEGLTHRAEATISGQNWQFVIRQPRKGYWTANGWTDDAFSFYREATTLKDAKRQVQAHANFLTVQATRETPTAPADKPDTFDTACDCPTPTHRMSCGEGAAPKVVAS